MREEQVQEAGFDLGKIIGQGVTAVTCFGKIILQIKDPKCQGSGEATATPPPTKDGPSSSSKSTKYTYKFTTNKDNMVEADVTLENGQTCHYTIDAKGQDPKPEIAKRAQQCIAEKA